MAEDLKNVFLKLGITPNVPDILASVLVVLKLQQMNIELLWDAYASGNPSSEELKLVRESNRRLTETMEQMVRLMLGSNGRADVHPD